MKDQLKMSSISHKRFIKIQLLNGKRDQNVVNINVIERFKRDEFYLGIEIKLR